jgi:HAD superfamily hydrolase (TIGR01509 family)
MNSISVKSLGGIFAGCIFLYISNSAGLDSPASVPDHVKGSFGDMSLASNGWQQVKIPASIICAVRRKSVVKAVFWDNDGVLVDTEKLYFQASREVLSEIGIDLTTERFIQISLKQGRSTFVLASEQGVKPEIIDRLHAERNRRYSELLQNGVRVLDGVGDALRKLQGKVSMGIVTSSLRAHFDIIHADTGLLPFFDFVLAREDYQKSKPHPEPFLTAAAQSGLRPEECIIVEDSARGLAAANAAGIRCIVVPNLLTRNGDFSEAYRVVNNVREVGDIVFDLISR